MPWLKLLHISAVILWCGTLLYLPFAISSARAATPVGLFETAGRRLLRPLFTHVSTPAALVAIASGTAIFVLHGPIAGWLVAKLAAVAMLVLAHAACGVLVLRAERDSGPVRGWSRLTAAVALLWIATIAWLVLHKPF